MVIRHRVMLAQGNGTTAYGSTISKAMARIEAKAGFDIYRVTRVFTVTEQLVDGKWTRVSCVFGAKRSIAPECFPAICDVVVG